MRKKLILCWEILSHKLQLQLIHRVDAMCWPVGSDNIFIRPICLCPNNMPRCPMSMPRKSRNETPNPQQFPFIFRNFRFSKIIYFYSSSFRSFLCTRFFIVEPQLRTKVYDARSAFFIASAPSFYFPKREQSDEQTIFKKIKCVASRHIA